MNSPNIETDYEKHLNFFCFSVKQEMYEAIQSLSWIEVGDGRDTGIESTESLVVAGKTYKVAYKCVDGTFKVREAYRFLCEGLATLKRICESGGLLTEVREDDE